MRWRRELLVCALLAALTLGVYWPVGHYDFIQYDDPKFITENPQIQKGLSWPGLVYAFTQPAVGNWHPVTVLSHMLDCQLFGTQPGPQHLVNVALHTLNAALLFLFLRSFTGAFWRSALVAGFFALHPLRVESVAWISERKDVLSGCFFLLSLWAWVKARRLRAADQGSASQSAAGLFRSRAFWLSLVFFALGLMSKPMIVTLPLVLLLLEFWSSGRLDPGPLLLRLAPFMALSAADCVITLLVQKSVGAMEVVRYLTFEDQLGNAVVSYVRYLGKLFWPSQLSIIYPHPANGYPLNDAWPWWQVAAAALLLLAISALCLRWARARPYLPVGWFWYLVMMLPVIGLVQVGEQAMADRYTYLPAIGILIALVWGGYELALALSGAQTTGAARLVPIAGALSIALLVALSVCSRVQVGYWQNTVSLFDHALAVTPDNPSAHFALGTGLEQVGRPLPAMTHYRVALAIDGRCWKAHYNLGQMHSKAGKYETAAVNYTAAERINPNESAIRLNLANTLHRLGRAREAIAEFEEALRLAPDSTEGLNNLAWLLATTPDAGLRDGARAVNLAERACALSEYHQPVMIGTLAAAYAEAGRFPDAIAAAEKACAVASAAGESATVSKNQELLELYRAGRPYRESGG